MTPSRMHASSNWPKLIEAEKDPEKVVSLAAELERLLTQRLDEKRCRRRLGTRTSGAKKDVI